MKEVALYMLRAKMTGEKNRWIMGSTALIVISCQPTYQEVDSYKHGHRNRTSRFFLLADILAIKEKQKSSRATCTFYILHENNIIYGHMKCF